jgi:hypothetical protein
MDISDDIDAIRSLVGRQFASLSWTEGGAPDLEAFTADFLPGAPLYASTRPVNAQTVAQFSARMASLAGGALASFEETVLGCDVHVFGNVAIAVVACANLENGRDTNRNVEMMLLVKDTGSWRIAAQAWDKETPERPIPKAWMEGR